MHIHGQLLTSLLGASGIAHAQSLVELSSRAPLSYATEFNDTYVASKSDGTTTLMQLVRSRPELSKLSDLVLEIAGQ